MKPPVAPWATLLTGVVLIVLAVLLNLLGGQLVLWWFLPGIAVVGNGIWWIRHTTHHDKDAVRPGP